MFQRNNKVSLEQLLIIKLLIMEELNFETVNKEVEALDLEALEVSMEIAMKREGVDVLSKICTFWRKIRNVLKLITKYVFIPKWRKTLELLIKTMDGICGIA